MAYRKNKEKTLKKTNLEYVSNVEKERYEQKVFTVRRKIERRRRYTTQWSEEVSKLEVEINMHSKRAFEAVKVKKDQLEEARATKIKKKQELQQLQILMEEETLFYKEKIVTIVEDRTEKEKANLSKISKLKVKVSEIRDFKQNKEKLAAELKARERKMEILQYKYEEKLEELQDARGHQRETVKREIEQQLQKLATLFTMDSLRDSAMCDQKVQLSEQLQYLQEQIIGLIQAIPAAKENTKWLQTRQHEITDIFNEKLKDLNTQANNACAPKEIPNYFLPVPRKKTVTSDKREDIIDSSKTCVPFVKEQNWLRLQVVLEAVRKLVAEAQALFLISEGAMAEEESMSDQERATRYRARRDAIFERRGEVLQHLLEVLAHRKDPERKENTTIDVVKGTCASGTIPIRIDSESTWAELNRIRSDSTLLLSIQNTSSVWDKSNSCEFLHLSQQTSLPSDC